MKEYILNEEQGKIIMQALLEMQTKHSIAAIDILRNLLETTNDSEPA